MSGWLILLSPEREIRIQTTCSAELKELALNFSLEASKLRESHPQGVPTSATICFDNAGSSQVTHDSNKTMRNSILHGMRPFVLKREQLFVPKFIKRFKKENRAKNAQWAAEFLLNRFLLRHAPYQLIRNGNGINFEMQWQNFANAYEYHRDQTKVMIINEAFSGIEPMAEFNFWWGASVKLSAIIALEGFAKMLSGQATKFAINLQEQ